MSCDVRACLEFSEGEVWNVMDGRVALPGTTHSSGIPDRDRVGGRMVGSKE